MRLCRPIGLCVTLLFTLLLNTAQAQSGSGSNTSSTGFCDKNRQTTASEQDRILQFSAALRDELDATGSDTVIISRSGLDLSRFQLRYSHSAILTKSATGAWTVRQLYYACDEGHPRLFDQGLAGFTAGSDNPQLRYISIVVMPTDTANAVRLASQDSARALGLLASTYSANAYAFSTMYQNCNQWVIELLAIAWGNLTGSDDTRANAQQWLRQAHYDPQPVFVNSGILMIASAFTPMLHLDDHPNDEREAMRLKVSLPSTIETFVRERLPNSRHIELCHNEKQIVVHHGWTPIADGCLAGDGDRVLSLL